MSNRTKRIALVIHALYGGGAERLMSELAEYWAEHHDLHLITWADSSTDAFKLPADVTRYGLDLLHVSSNPLFGILANFKRVQKLRKTLLKISPEFVLSFCDKMNIATLQASKGLDLPVWISEHSDPEQQRLSRLWEMWRKKTYPRCSGCVVLTEAIASYMHRWVPPEHLRVIPPALSSLHPPACHSDYRDRPMNILFAGRLSPEKRVDLLIEAWRNIQPTLPGWSLQIAGDGPQRAMLESQAAGLNELDFLGWVDDTGPLYKDAQLLVQPSDYEGFPVAILEALQAGVPVISTDCSTAIGELNCPEEVVVTTPTGSATAIAAAITTLASSSERRTAMSNSASKVAERYSWNQVGKLWDRILPAN